MMSGGRRPELGPEALWGATDPEAAEKGEGTRGHLQTLSALGISSTAAVAAVREGTASSWVAHILTPLVPALPTFPVLFCIWIDSSSFLLSQRCPTPRLGLPHTPTGCPVLLLNGKQGFGGSRSACVESLSLSRWLLFCPLRRQSLSLRSTA